jgi:hypothetical protein
VSRGANPKTHISHPTGSTNGVLFPVIHFSRQSNWRLAYAIPTWLPLVRIKISAALPYFLCLVILICSPFTSKAQGTVEAEANSPPEWRWEAVTAALEDPSIEVQQAAVEWLAALSEQRYAPPQGETSKRLCELLKARLVPANTGGLYVLRALPWVDPTCIGAAPQGPICLRIRMKAFARPPLRRLEAWVPRQRMLPRR